jgi:hypothetical protein
MNRITDNPGDPFDITIMGDLCPYAIGKNHSLSLGPKLENILANCENNMANLECPITSAENKLAKTGPNLKADPRDADVLSKLHVNICNLANNHIKDYGKTGISDTCAILDRKGIRHFGLSGMHGNRALIVEIKDLRIGLISFTENEFSTDDTDGSGAIGLDHLVQFNEIRTLREFCDHIIVQYHGGVEFYPYPTPGQQKYCRFLIEAGSDMVVCHHSHIISGEEDYAGKKIFYGLGNLYFPEGGNKEEWYQGQGIGIKVSDNLKSEIIHVRYDMDENLLEIDAKPDIQLQLAEMNRVIGDDSLLQEAWLNYCVSNQNRTLLSLFKPGRIFRLFHKYGLFSNHLWKKADLSLLNLLRCESHQERLLSTIKLINEQRNAGRNS